MTDAPAPGASRPDLAACDACQAEVRDPLARRYRYPFTRCGRCDPAGPDGADEAWARRFPPCEACRAEAADPADRRHGAAHVACHACGPRAWLERTDGRAFGADRYTMLDDVDAVGGLLVSGEVVAVKDAGGYRVLCDATNAAAVARLRAGKGRPRAPLALVARDLDVARRYAHLDDADEALLRGPAGPAVLVPRRDAPDGGARPLADDLAPGTGRLALALPSTPLLALALRRIDRPVAVTSGNAAGDPVCVDDDDARRRLAPIAPWILRHDAPTRQPVDDALVARVDGAARVLRLGRGLAPATVPLPEGLADAPPLLALGGDDDGAFALVSGGRAWVSAGVGDVRAPATLAAFQAAVDRVTRATGHAATAVAFDADPASPGQAMGRGLARSRNLPGVGVPWHHASVAACLAENGRPAGAPPVLGLVLDDAPGPGRLRDSALLLADYGAARRVGALKPVAVLDGAVRDGEADDGALATTALADLWAQLRAQQTRAELDVHFGDVPIVARLAAGPAAALDAALADPATPRLGSYGRCFAALAAALELPEATETRGRFTPAAALEARVTPAALAEARREPYPFATPRLPAGPDGAPGLPYVEPLGAWRAVLGDLWAGNDPALVAARFLTGLADGLVRLCATAARAHGADAVALTGAAFRAPLLLELVAGGLRDAGLAPITHRALPPDDGCLALGQAAVAAAALGARAGAGDAPPREPHRDHGPAA